MANEPEGSPVTVKETEEKFIIKVVTKKHGTITWEPGDHAQAHFTQLAEDGGLEELIEDLKLGLADIAEAASVEVCSVAKPLYAISVIEDVFGDGLMGLIRSLSEDAPQLFGPPDQKGPTLDEIADFVERIFGGEFEEGPPEDEELSNLPEENPPHA